MADIKKGAKVIASVTRQGVTKQLNGKLVETYSTRKGIWHEVMPEDGKKSIKVRPANLKAA